MKTIKLGGVLDAPALAVGCMRLASLPFSEAEKFIACAKDNGLYFFDHADIYGRGECEKIFAKAVSSLKIPREQIVLQSKCGIVPGKMYDFSKQHILESAEGILKRLNTEYLDVLLLHRPDALMEPEEVAEAFTLLEKSGKVRYFGVSNMNAFQLELLSSALKQRIIANQMQFSPVHAPIISKGVEANMLTEGSADRDGGILEYCRLKNITIQAWSPFQYGFFDGVYLGDEKYAELNKTVKEIAEKYNVTEEAVIVAWFCRHPAGIQTVAGTMNAKRLLSLVSGTDIYLTREEWYRIYISAGHILP